MRRLARLACLSSLLLGCTATAVVAQPDLSGLWEPIPEASTVTLPASNVVPGAPSPPPPPRTIALNIARQGLVVTMERRLLQGGQESVRSFTYTLDGKATVNQNGPIELTTTAAWEGDVLVLSSRAAIEGRQFGTVRERYALVDGQLVVDSTREWPGGTSTSHDVHRRR